MQMDMLVPIILASLPLGIIHALDADHIAAVSSLSGRTNGRRGPIKYALTWSLGHGGLLLLLSVATLMFHWALPPSLPYWAERLVGLVLIAAGASMLWALFRGHRIAGPHAHANNLRLKLPFAVGMLHGLAGSAGMFALIPMTLYQPELGFVYVAIFSLGVMLGMMVFGVFFGQVQAWLGTAMPRMLGALRSMVGIGAIGMGFFWLQAG